MRGRQARVSLRLAALIVAGLAGIAAGWAGFLAKKTSELPVYVRAAARLAEGEPIYRPQEEKPFTYPPFFAVPFLPLVGLGEPWQRSAWYLANLLSLLGALALLRDALRRAGSLRGETTPWWRTELAFWALVLVLALRHLTSPLENQSHDLIVLLCCTLAVRALAFGRETAGGAWAGAGAACKATPLLFAPVLVWQRRGRAALALLAAAVLLTLVPDIVWPKTGEGSWWRDWIDNFAGKARPDAATEAEGAWSAWNFLNQNLAGTLHRLFTRVDSGPTWFDVSLIDLPRSLLRWLTLAANLGVLSLLLVATRPSLAARQSVEERPRRRLLEGGAILSAMLLLSPMSSKSHFCLLVVPLAATAAELVYRRRDPFLGACLAVALLCGTLTTKGIVGRELGNELLARGSVTFTTLACLAASCRCLMSSPRVAHPPAAAPQLGCS